MRSGKTKRALAVILLVGAWSAGALMAAAATDTRAGTEPRTMAAAEFDLAAYTGRVVLLDFWASWCKPCKQSLPWLSALQRKYADQGLSVVAVNVDKDAEAAGAMLKEMDPGILVVMDPQGVLASRFELQGMPSSFLIGRDGRIVASHVGFLTSEAQGREAEILALLQKTPEGEKP